MGSAEAAAAVSPSLDLTEAPVPAASPGPSSRQQQFTQTFGVAPSEQLYNPYEGGPPIWSWARPLFAARRNPFFVDCMKSPALRGGRISGHSSSKPAPWQSCRCCLPPLPRAVRCAAAVPSAHLHMGDPSSPRSPVLPTKALPARAPQGWALRLTAARHAAPSASPSSPSSFSARRRWCTGAAGART